MLLYMTPPDSPNSRLRRCRLTLVTADSPAGARGVLPPHPADHDQLEGQNEQRDPHHRADRRRDHVRLDVDRLPDRETSPVAALAREPVPDREGDRHELAGRQRRARGRAERTPENGGPFALVVAE